MAALQELQLLTGLDKLLLGRGRLALSAFRLQEPAGYLSFVLLGGLKLSCGFLQLLFRCICPDLSTCT